MIPTHAWSGRAWKCQNQLAQLGQSRVETEVVKGHQEKANTPPPECDTEARTCARDVPAAINVLETATGYGMNAHQMSQTRTFRLKKGKGVRTKNLTSEQSRSMSEQQARMFTPDGQFRMVMDIREKASKGLLKPTR